MVSGKEHQVSTSWKPPAPGALDDTPWPDQLTARVVEPLETDDRVHGYSLLGDLALHYRSSDVLFLALVGETPNVEQSALFDLALCSFAAPNVGEAPIHLAVLTRLSGAPLASALGAGLVAAADQARALVAVHGPLIAWLAAPHGDLPAEFRDDRSTWGTVIAQAVTSRGASVPSISPDMTRDAARIALLHAAGLHSAEQMEAAIVSARVGAMAGEAIATGPQHLSTYPVKVPPFHYVVEDVERK
jgi:hypothetical protein